MAMWTTILKSVSGNATVIFLSLFPLSLCIYSVFSYLQNRRKLPLPPKPRGLPVLGNTIDFVQAAKKNEIHLLLQKWEEQYGDYARTSRAYDELLFEL